MSTIRVSNPYRIYSVFLNDKQYLIFGDVHGKQIRNCLNNENNIADLIRAMIFNKEGIDVFFEIPYDKKINNHTEILTQTAYQFKQCFESKYTCNASFHCIDIRDGANHTMTILTSLIVFPLINKEDNEQQIINLCKIFSNKYLLLQYYHICILSNNFIEDVTSWINLISKNDQKLKELLTKRINYGMIRNNQHLLRYKMSKLESKDFLIATKIKKYILKQIDSFKIDQILTRFSNKDFSNFENDANSLIRVEGCLVDFYTLILLFLKDREDKKVIFMGQKHAENISRFLETLGGKVNYYKSNDKLNRCIEIPESEIFKN